MVTRILEIVMRVLQAPTDGVNAHLPGVTNSGMLVIQENLDQDVLVW